MEIDDVYFITQEIIPPLPGGLKYAAKVQALYINAAGKRQKINHDFGETWGKTESEATEKMKLKVNQWVIAQQ